MTKLAIMGAMEEEIEPLLSYFDKINVVEFANNKYYEVNYKGLDIVIDVFNEFPDTELYIYGVVESEKIFVKSLIKSKKI